MATSAASRLRLVSICSNFADAQPSLRLVASDRIGEDAIRMICLPSRPGSSRAGKP
jgi:hypothetical protein